MDFIQGGMFMKSKTLILCLLGGAALSFGAIDQYFYPGEAVPPTAIAFTLITVALIFLWYRFDAAEAGYRRTPWLNVGVIAVALLALPYYLFRSRGAKRGFIAIGLLVLAFIGMNLLSMAGAYAVYYGMQT
jgi:hypothetical protein